MGESRAEIVCLGSGALVMKRADSSRVAPEVGRALRGLDLAVKEAGLDPQLVELVKVRVSQINRCAYCLDMHTKDALAAGERPQRLFGLSAWREAPFYTDRERAALAWAEAVTLCPDGVPDDVYEVAQAQFAERELVFVTLAVIAINSWNRLAVSFRAPAGTYRPDLA